MRVLGGPWPFLTGDLESGEQGYPWCHELPCLTTRKLPWMFCVNIFIRSVLRMGGTWRMLRDPDRRLGGQGHHWCHGLHCLDPRKIPWKFCVDIFIRSMSGRGGSRTGVLGGPWGFLSRDLDDRVILGVMDDLVLTKRRYAESFMLISSLEVCQEWGVLYGGTLRTLRFPDRRLGEQGLARHHGCNW